MDQTTRDLALQYQEFCNEVLTSTDKVEALLKRWRIPGLRNYSWNNRIMLLLQKPEGTLFATMSVWNELGRFVNKGEHKLYVWRPIFYASKKETEDGEEKTEVLRGFMLVKGPVDISQTNGKDLDIGANDCDGNPTITLDDLIRAYPEFTFQVTEAISDGRTDGKRIMISKRKNKTQMIASAIHELAHCLLGHLAKDCKLSREDQELEAEAVSYMVCLNVGIKNKDAAAYINSWHGDKKSLGKSGSIVISLSQKILDKATGYQPVKED